MLVRRLRTYRWRTFLFVASLAAIDCGSSPITSARIEPAISTTFANLVHVQLVRLGLAPVTAFQISVTASCRKIVPGRSSGAGDWVCVLDWNGPNRKRLRDTYDLSVTADGCYTATVDGAESGLGGPTIIRPGGVSSRNLLYAFDGCFNTM